MVEGDDVEEAGPPGASRCLIDIKANEGKLVKIREFTSHDDGVPHSIQSSVCGVKVRNEVQFLSFNLNHPVRSLKLDCQKVFRWMWGTT